MNQATQIAVVVPALSVEVAASVKAQAVRLSTADKSFEAAVLEVANGVARIMGAQPTFDHWEAVQKAFIADYTAARDCKEETSRKRWQAVANALADNFAQEKPAKPTKSAAVKREQRSDAESKAHALIDAAEATTPQAILALAESAGEPVAAPVVAALAKIAGDTAKQAGKSANDAAKVEVKTLREAVRKGLINLSLSQLREVAELVAKYQPDDAADADAEADAEADADETA